MITVTLDELGSDPPCESSADWNREGVVILPGFFAGNPLIDRYAEEWKQAHGYRGTHDYDGMPMLLADQPKGWPDACPYMDHQALRALCCDGELAQVLRSLTGDDMAVNLNLTTWLSTERDWHADSYLNEPEVGDWYAAVWIALDDIHPDSGVFQYVPGSHRWPQITRYTIERFVDLEDPMWPKHSELLLTPLFTEEIRRRWAPVVSYVPQKGDLLIWHGRLLHRGSKPACQGIARPALIAHYSGIHHRPAMPKARRHVLGGHYFPNETPPPVGS